MAKRVLRGAVGILAAEGRIELDAPAPVPWWTGPGDERGAITVRHLLTMRSGLAFVEKPGPGERSDVISMLFGNERGPVPDTAAFAASKPLAHPPGEVFHYASGTSSILSSIVRDVVGRDHYEPWLRETLLNPVGMTSARLRFDEAGTWLA